MADVISCRQTPSPCRPSPDGANALSIRTPLAHPPSKSPLALIGLARRKGADLQSQGSRKHPGIGAWSLCVDAEATASVIDSHQFLLAAVIASRGSLACLVVAFCGRLLSLLLHDALKTRLTDMNPRHPRIVQTPTTFHVPDSRLTQGQTATKRAKNNGINTTKQSTKSRDKLSWYQQQQLIGCS